VLLARGWQSTVNRQRDERLDRTKVSRTSTIGGALANYEKALQGARSLWLASDGVAGWDGREAAPPTGRWSPGPTRPCTPPRRVGGTVLRRPHRRGRGGGVPGSGVPEPPQGHAVAATSTATCTAQGQQGQDVGGQQGPQPSPSSGRASLAPAVEARKTTPRNPVSPASTASARSGRAMGSRYRLRPAAASATRTTRPPTPELASPMVALRVDLQHEVLGRQRGDECLLPCLLLHAGPPAAAWSACCQRPSSLVPS
jgi:hypothetical protein